MTSYLIYRHGSNKANQSMTPVMPVAIVDAKTREAAKAKAAESVTVYNNQFLSAVPASRAKKEDWNYASQYGEVVA